MEENARILPVFITDNNTGVKYELDFCRDSIRFAEARQFDIADGHKQPQTFSYDIFFYAFRMHNKSASRDFTDKLLNRLGGPMSDSAYPVIKRLTELYMQALSGNDLTDEEAAKNGGVTVEL